MCDNECKFSCDKEEPIELTDVVPGEAMFASTSSVLYEAEMLVAMENVLSTLCAWEIQTELKEKILTKMGEIVDSIKV